MNLEKVSKNWHVKYNNELFLLYLLQGVKLT